MPAINPAVPVAHLHLPSHQQRLRSRLAWAERGYHSGWRSRNEDSINHFRFSDTKIAQDLIPLTSSAPGLGAEEMTEGGKDVIFSLTVLAIGAAKQCNHAITKILRYYKTQFGVSVNCICTDCMKADHGSSWGPSMQAEAIKNQTQVTAYFRTFMWGCLVLVYKFLLLMKVHPSPQSVPWKVTVWWAQTDTTASKWEK